MKPKYTPNPLLKDLPGFLKDPDNFKRIRMEEYDILGSRCGHSDTQAWQGCLKCLERVREHKRFLKGLGFTSSAQYYEWRKTHEMIRDTKIGKQKKVKLKKYNE